MTQELIANMRNSTASFLSVPNSRKVAPPSSAMQQAPHLTSPRRCSPSATPAQRCCMGRGCYVCYRTDGPRCFTLALFRDEEPALTEPRRDQDEEVWRWPRLHAMVAPTLSF